MRSKADKILEGVGIGAIVTAIIGLVVFISPILSVISGWLTGTIIKWLFGAYITNGLNLLFNTTRFAPESIPMICSALAVIGSYFKSHQTNNNKK